MVADASTDAVFQHRRRAAAKTTDLIVGGAWQRAGRYECCDPSLHGDSVSVLGQTTAEYTDISPGCDEKGYVVWAPGETPEEMKTRWFRIMDLQWAQRHGSCGTARNFCGQAIQKLQDFDPGLSTELARRYKTFGNASAMHQRNQHLIPLPEIKQNAKELIALTNLSPNVECAMFVRECQELAKKSTKDHKASWDCTRPWFLNQDESKVFDIDHPALRHLKIQPCLKLRSE